jgi:NAD(P)-dependent dehydrogenase (short-subunit alcohol dehydrogenase family)
VRPPFALHGRVAVVTGACGRLGPVWIEALASAGATVFGLDLPAAAPAESLRALVAASEGHVRLAHGDVTDRASLESALARIRAECGGGPDILVNNAGIDTPPSAAAAGARIEAMEIEPWRRVLEVNLLGAFQASQVFGAAMLERRRGSIVNIGSLYAAVSPDARFYDHIPQDPPFLKPPAYGASKGALVNLTRYLATHWAPFGVRVNALSPGGVLGEQDPEFRRKFTSRVPLGRMAEGADLGGPLVFLASDAAGYVTGIELRVDGGFTAW